MFKYFTNKYVENLTRREFVSRHVAVLIFGSKNKLFNNTFYVL